MKIYICVVVFAFFCQGGMDISKACYGPLTVTKTKEDLESNAFICLLVGIVGLFLIVS